MYCKDCMPEKYKATDRDQSLKYYSKNKGKINPVRNANRRINTKVCTICNNKFEFANCKYRDFCSDECKRKAGQRNQKKADLKRRPPKKER